MSDFDPMVELDKLIAEAGLRVTFDPKRSTALPCFDCGRDDVPRGLVDIGWNEQQQMKITRPFCPKCGATREAINAARREGKAEGLREAARDLTAAADEHERLAAVYRGEGIAAAHTSGTKAAVLRYHAAALLARAEEVER